MELTQEKIKKLGRLLIPATLLLFCLLVVKDPVFFQELELKTLDLRFIMRGQEKPPGNVIIVAIDEKSVQTWGRWPPPRAKMAALLESISEQSPRVILFDIIFSEKELSTSGTDLEEDELTPGDQAFQAAIENAGNVVIPFALDVLTGYQESSEFSAEISDAVIFSAYEKVEKPLPGAIPPPEASAALAPLAPFADAAAALGHVYILPDRDGILRREMVAVKFGADYYPPMTLQAARLYLGLSGMEMELRRGEGVLMGKTLIPTDEWGRMLVDYFGKEKTYDYHSAMDVVDGRVDPKLFEDKVVIIGASALATADSKLTPFSKNMMGFEKNATVIENVITNRFIQRSEKNMERINLGLILFYGLILWIVMPRFRAVGGAVVGTTLFGVHIGVALILFARNRIWIDVVYPAGSVLSTYIVYTGFQYFTEEKKAREIRKMFQSYVSPRVVSEMIKRPELARLGGYKQEVTVLFSDVRGFTVFCEKRKDRPGEVVEILNEYLGAMTEVVFQWEGTLDKFVGDAVMVFWGAPLPQEDHARRAVGCAWDMLRRLAELQAKWASEGKEPLDIGIGINTGEAIVGNIGADGKKMDYTVIGDAVNLAARVESLTRKYEASIIITDYTYKHLRNGTGNGNGQPPSDPMEITQEKDPFLIGKLDEVKVKGKEELVPIYGLTNAL